MRMEGCPWGGKVIKAATKNGHFKVLKWAVKNGCPWPHFVARKVARWRYANDDVLHWIYDEGPFCDTNEYHSAAKECGNVWGLKWCHQIGLPFDSRYCTTAVKQGQLFMLKWLRKVGVPWDRSVLVEAMERKDLRILKWIFSHGGGELV